MEGDTAIKDRLPFVRPFFSLAVSIISLLATNPSLLKPSFFEEESDSSDQDTDDVPDEDSGQEGPDQLPPCGLEPDQEAYEEVDHDKFNFQKFDIDAVVTLAAAIFTSKTSSFEAHSLRCSPANNLGGPDSLLHERTVAVLDALAYVSVDERSPIVAIGLTMKPLQLVITTNSKIPSTNILEHLDTICSTLQNISNAKFYTCPGPVSQSNVDLREVSPSPNFLDENLNSHYNDLFLQIYKYSHDRLQRKNKKRWEVIERFRDQMTAWKNDVSQTNISDLDEQHKTFFDTLSTFYLWALGLRDCLDQFSRSGWKIDLDKMVKLRTCWHDMVATAHDILGQKVAGRYICDYWAMKVFPACSRPDTIEKPLQLQRAIEKLISFHRHVFTLIRFANSKRMRSSFFSSKITVLPAEKTRPSILSWPLNKREWGDLLGSIYDKHGLTRQSGSDVTKAEQKMKSRAERCGLAATIHCECAMVAYLHKYAAFQAISYIGVSKLFCKACHFWMEAFNTTMITKFGTRGSHDKWYGGWARPELGKAANQGKIDEESWLSWRVSYASTSLARAWQGGVGTRTAQVQMSPWYQGINSQIN